MKWTKLHQYLFEITDKALFSLVHAGILTLKEYKQIDNIIEEAIKRFDNEET